MDGRGLWLCSVPKHDAKLVARLLPGATATTEGIPGANPPPDARVWAVTIHDHIDVSNLAEAPNLEAVITRSDGFDHLPLEALRAHEIQAYHLEGYATNSVARLAIAFVLSLLRRIPEANQRLHTDSWTRAPFVGRDLEDVTIGVLGTGRIGSAVVRMLQAMGAQVLAHDIAPDAALSVEYVELPELLARSDVLTLHIPLLDSTRYLMDANRLALLPAGALLVNTARGDIVDQAAVEDALRSGRLAGYAADVLPREPQCPDLHRFQDLPQALLTPHLGAHNEATLQRRYECTRDIALAVLSGQPQDVAQFRLS